MSNCETPEGLLIPGGMGVGFVVSIPKYNFKIYHAGDTNIFSDMQIIDDLYKPDVVLIPISRGMSPFHAAFAVKNYFPSCKIVVPMHLGNNAEETIDKTFEFDSFAKQCEELGVTGKQIIHPKEFFGGKALFE